MDWNLQPKQNDSKGATGRVSSEETGRLGVDAIDSSFAVTRMHDMLVCSTILPFAPPPLNI